uniref:Ras association domain-containing protein 2 n=2 Tax=Culex pipiens TaxID=7175 RepID=A0A8D8DF25_CULPI
MWKCHKCGKPVFFAERKQSLGYDWHPECLRCEECGKRLNPGQHAEHKGVPYCHVPCYGALFGPQLFGHGTRVESHKSFGAPELKKQTPIRSPSGGAGSGGPQIPRAHLESKLRAYNQFHDSKSAEVRSREVNGRLVLEGALRIYWGVQGIIHLKEDDDQRTVVTVRKRNSYRFSASSMAQQELDDQEDKENLNPDRSDPMSSSLTEGGDQNDTTTISESISYDTLSISSDLNSISSSKPNSGENSKEVSPSHVVGNGTNKYVTLPPKLDVKQLEWDEIDDLLQVERKVDETEKPYRTMPSPLHSAKQASASDHSEITESVTDTDYKTLTPHSNSSSSDSNKTSATTTTLNGTEEDFRTPEGTLRSHDFDAFKMQMSQEFIDGAADLGSTDGTLKLNQPIDPARINDSLKLYNDSVMNRSLSEEQCRNAGVFSLPQGNITDSFHVENDGTLKHPDNISSPAKSRMLNGAAPSANGRTQIAYQRHQSDSASITSPGTDTDTWTGDRGLLRSKSQGNAYSGNSFMDSEDEGTETLKASGRPQTSIHIKMDCYDELNGVGSAAVVVSPTDESITTASLTEVTSTAMTASTTVTTTTTEDDGVVLRKAPKTGSTAIKRRSGNRRSRTKLKRRCSINGHFYNRETSFFTPPHGSQMNVWVSSMVNTQEVIQLLLEKYKVESRAENFALFVIKDNGEQRKLKEDDYPLVTRIILGPHEDIAKLFLMDGQQTPEISSEVAQFLNLSIPECRAILERYHEEEQRELLRIRTKYAELKRRIVQRMESLKVRL